MDDKEVRLLLGQIMGELKGLSSAVQNNHAALNRRIDDMTQSNNQRLQSVESRVHTLEGGQRTLMLKSATTGSAAAIVAAVTVEFIRMKLGGN
ncbi:hypothetical protein [Collimonas antrihumi]|uniref:hypothetical protein n=1 Tax=Collimonas antrihumi TaxID=1940615 RepID=UPI001B8A9480|nr:hypothetical protein [Collimonas antrihumi]